MFSAAIPFAVGMGLVAAGLTSTTVLFGGLYMLSSAVVFGLAALVLWATPTSSRRFGVGWTMLLVLVGAALASVNELVYFALPVTTLAIVLRERFVLERAWRQVWSGPGIRIAGWMWLGFVPVFLVTRAIIWSNCHSGGCYEGSDIVLGPDVLTALPNRLLSWLAPLMWHASSRVVAIRWSAGCSRSPPSSSSESSPGTRSGISAELGSVDRAWPRSRSRLLPACSSYSARRWLHSADKCRRSPTAATWALASDSAVVGFAAACCSSPLILQEVESTTSNGVPSSPR